MPIKVTCPNGHRLEAKDSRAGTMGKCPACGIPVQIPAPTVNPFTESSILRILDVRDGVHFSSTESAVHSVPDPNQEVVDRMISRPAKTKATQICPQCDWEIDSGYRICPNCRHYLVGS